MYDVFIAELRCPAATRSSPATADTAMQTHLRDDADGLVGSGYALITAPRPVIRFACSTSGAAPRAGPSSGRW
jgi:hypothetical protein